MNEKTITLYRPTGPDELLLVEQSGFKKWPPRLPEQPIFYPVANRIYAEQISREWNVPSAGIGYVTMFKVKASFMKKYDLQIVGDDIHTEWWIPSEDLEEMNSNIVGLIEVIAVYK